MNKLLYLGENEKNWMGEAFGYVCNISFIKELRFTYNKMISSIKSGWWVFIFWNNTWYNIKILKTYL